MSRQIFSADARKFTLMELLVVIAAVAILAVRNTIRKRVMPTCLIRSKDFIMRKKIPLSGSLACFREHRLGKVE